MTTSSPRRGYRVGRAKTGLGLFAVKPFKKGDFIARYWGRRIPDKVADQLWTKYLFEINSRWTIDGSNRRNLARYINHSCKPNAETDIKKGKILISARKRIEPGEEITYNYGRGYFDVFIKPHGCKCAACGKGLRKTRSLRGAKKRKRATKRRKAKR